MRSNRDSCPNGHPYDGPDARITVRANGQRQRWCAACRRKGTPIGRPPAEPIERFWAKVRITPGCWLWMAAVNDRGYGRFTLDRTGKLIPAHRFAWSAENGPIPPGLLVCHSCDNPPCVNPAHLWLGTQSDNMIDCLAKGRHRHQKGSK
jgi:hypothetical protein